MPWGAIWMALRLGGGRVFDGVLRGLSAALKWLLADWRNFAVALLGAFYVFANFVHLPHLRAQRDAARALLVAEEVAHAATVRNYIDASAEAERQAQANVARVTAEQEAITDEVTRDLRSDLAAVAARFDRLRARDAARTDPGRADPAGLPGTGNAAGGTAGAARDQDLRSLRGIGPGELTLCPAGFVCLTFDQAQRASEDAHRHDRLIDFVIGQSAVRFTPEGDR